LSFLKAVYRKFKIKLAVFIMANGAFFAGLVMLAPGHGVPPVTNCSFAPDRSASKVYSFALSNAQCRYVSYDRYVVSLTVRYPQFLVVKPSPVGEGVVLIAIYPTDAGNSTGSISSLSSDVIYRSDLTVLYDSNGEWVETFVGGDGSRVFVSETVVGRKAERLYAGRFQVVYQYLAGLADPVLVDKQVLGFLDKTVI